MEGEIQGSIKDEPRSVGGKGTAQGRRLFLNLYNYIGILNLAVGYC